MLGRLLIALAALTVLGAAAWFGWATLTQRVVTDWLDARAAEGWLVNYEDLDVTGFPTDFRTGFTGLELADPDTGWLWTLPTLTFESAALRPDRVRAIWPETQTLASPAERLTVTSSEMTSELDLQPAARFALDASDTALNDVTVQSDQGWRMALPEGRLQMTRLPDTVSRYAVTFTARDLVPPARARSRLDPGGLLPEAIARLDYDAVMTFDRPWDLRAIEERRPQITHLDLREMNAVWGALLLRATGEVTVDARGVPEGALAVRAENWREMVAMATRSGLIPEGIRGTVEGILGVVAGLSGDPDVIDASLGFEDGRMFLGPLPLGPAPRLGLR